jgi:hypothetical protein
MSAARGRDSVSLADNGQTLGRQRVRKARRPHDRASSRSQEDLVVLAIATRESSPRINLNVEAEGRRPSLGTALRNQPANGALVPWVGIEPTRPLRGSGF